MENVWRPMNEDQNFELPPGFRFHPTDEELITHYLSQKVLDSCFCARAIGEIDLNKCEPWDLPWRAKMGEKEWYFFCVRDKKYPTGLRTNRATGAGYWKATGKDKEIYKAKALIGMKKTLVFYRGRAPKGEKTNWVMHEYRLEGKHSMYNLPKTAKTEWALSRVFQKSEKEAHAQAVLVRFNSFGKELPPLMDSSPYNSETRNTAGESSHVTCFSDPNQSEDLRTYDDIIVDSFETPNLGPSYASNSNPSHDISPASRNFTKSAPNNVSHNQSTQIAQEVRDSQCLDYFMAQDHAMLRMLIENHGSSTRQKSQKAQERDFDADISSVMCNNEMFQRSFGNQEYSSAYVGHVDSGCLWDF